MKWIRRAAFAEAVKKFEFQLIVFVGGPLLHSYRVGCNKVNYPWKTWFNCNNVYLNYMPCSDSIFVIKLTTSRARKFLEKSNLILETFVVSFWNTKANKELLTYKLDFLNSIK